MRGSGEQRLTGQDVLSITSSIQPSPATVWGTRGGVRADGSLGLRANRDLALDEPGAALVERTYS